VNIGNVIFEEKPIIDSDSVLIPINIQDITLVIENNVQTNINEIVLDQDNNKVLPQIPKMQPQQPQEVSLRRSIRERRSATPNNYIIFLQEHKDGICLTYEDPINFC